jgi:hypothetical protein
LKLEDASMRTRISIVVTSTSQSAPEMMTPTVINNGALRSEGLKAVGLDGIRGANDE